MKVIPPLKWHGGKHYLARRIIALMPRHLHYVEPYFGGGAVLLARDPYDLSLAWGEESHHKGVSEVVNDVNGELTNFWRVLQNPRDFSKFRRIVEAVPFSQAEWEQSVADLGTGRVTRAVRFFIWCRQSRAGKFDAFATLSRNRTRRKMNEQASAWWTTVDGLHAVHERLKRVVILNDDAINIIRQQDGPKTLFYLDPPYLHDTRVSTADYQHEMTEEQHAEMLDVICECEGHVMLSGYHSKLYDKSLSKWRCQEFQIDNKASGAKKKPVKTECVWMNFPKG